VSEQVRLVKNEDSSAYELFLGDARVSLVDYYLAGDVVVFPHTETLPAYLRRGLAAQVVRFALDDVRSQARKVRPTCPYVATFIRRNPEYSDLIA
jgi:predicted GNAT family acetyltransferase